MAGTFPFIEAKAHRSELVERTSRTSDPSSRATVGNGRSVGKGDGSLPRRLAGSTGVDAW